MPNAARRKQAPAPIKATPAELFQDILVYLDDNEASQNALAYANALAIAAQGNLSGLMFGFLAPYPATIYMEATPDIWLAAQRKAEEEAAALEAKLSKQLEGVPARPELRRYNVMGGEAGGTLAQHARYADTVIIGISGRGPSRLERNLFEGALFSSGRPVITVPEAFRRHGPPEKILVAWRPGREATRAVHDALPLLKAAKEVRVVAVDDGVTTGQEAAPGSDIATHLARHDIHVEVKHVPASGGAIASVLLGEARYFGADLIVMGGYGHSRLREWILGGATRDMLQVAEVPVLLAH